MGLADAHSVTSTLESVLSIFAPPLPAPTGATRCGTA
jgi:hypothetical protein